MNRNEAIQIIEGLFPADAGHPDTAEVGQKLLEQAKREACGWRSEPDAVLIRYAELCQNEERRQAGRRG